MVGGFVGAVVASLDIESDVEIVLRHLVDIGVDVSIVTLAIVYGIAPLVPWVVVAYV